MVKFRNILLSVTLLVVDNKTEVTEVRKERQGVGQGGGGGVEFKCYWLMPCFVESMCIVFIGTMFGLMFMLKS